MKKRWKYQDFSVIQILREINLGESRCSETAVFAILGARNFVDLVNFAFQKGQKFTKSRFRAPKCVKLADFALLTSPKLISRKIGVIEKLLNFHTV